MPVSMGKQRPVRRELAGGQELQGNLPADAQLNRAPDRPHSPFAKRAFDGVTLNAGRRLGGASIGDGRIYRIFRRSKWSIRGFSHSQTNLQKPVKIAHLTGAKRDRNEWQTGD